jgi:hypothetical protein
MRNNALQCCNTHMSCYKALNCIQEVMVCEKHCNSVMQHLHELVQSVYLHSRGDGLRETVLPLSNEVLQSAAVLHAAPVSASARKVLLCNC